MTCRTENPIPCRPHLRPGNVKADLDSLAQVVAAKDAPAILGGNASVKGVSIFAAEPIETFAFHLNESRPFEKLRRFLSRYTLTPTDWPKGLFSGGWIGYFGYELGRFIETLPQRAADDVGLPVIHLAFYDKAILYDHTHHQFAFVAVEMDDHDSVESKFAVLAEWLNEAAHSPAHPVEPIKPDAYAPSAFQTNMTLAAYFAALQRIHRHIIDGDVYQINFSQRFSTPFSARCIDLFRRLNYNNPSPYAAYLAWGHSAVVSASPELFLDVRNDRVRTCPIKGTRPRNPALPDSAPPNQAQYTALLDSEKDRAELAMIVDLERNDLARVCVPGSRYVSCPRRIEIFPTVYHAVAEVEGRLARPPGPDRLEALLRATFPGGSITGAPKIRAMEIIDDLEPTARSVYTGSIGWIGLNFDMCLNIVIRTVIVHNEVAFVQTGGGIVADSDPQSEWDESLIKAGVLLAGIQNTPTHIQI